MKKPEGLPEVLFVGRRKKMTHKLCVFLIESRGQDGIPLSCRLLRDDEEVTIEEGMEFMTGYIPEVMFDPK